MVQRTSDRKQDLGNSSEMKRKRTMLERWRCDLPGITAFSMEAVGSMENVHRCDSTSKAVLLAAVIRWAAARRVPALPQILF